MSRLHKYQSHTSRALPLINHAITNHRRLYQRLRKPVHHTPSMLTYIITFETTELETILEIARLRCLLRTLLFGDRVRIRAGR